MKLSLLAAAVAGWKPREYMPKTTLPGQWSDKVAGIVARQAGRRSFDGNRPSVVKRMAFEIAENDIDELLNLILGALYEESSPPPEAV